MTQEVQLALVYRDQCGLELQAPHVRTRTKRRIAMADLDLDTLPSDSLRFSGWAPQTIAAAYDDLDPAARYALEAVALCERGVERRQSITSGDVELAPPTVLAPGTATTIRVDIPPRLYADGHLEIAVHRLAGPDVLLSELRLYSSAPARPILTVVGDSRGGLIGTVAGPDSAGIAGAAIEVRAAGQADGRPDPIVGATDAIGLFRLALGPLVAPGQEAELMVTARVGDQAVSRTIDTRDLARGLRELPGPADRFDLAGEWSFHGGPFDPARAAVEGGTPAGAPEGARARVPGHVIFDSLVPIDGVATLERTFEVPAGWPAGRVFIRFDGAYGRAEVRINGAVAGSHGGGATSFDLDVTGLLAPGENRIAVTLTEFTPHAVLDDMSWYAHLSLLGIWRDVFLFRTSPVHLGGLDLRTDWDPDTRTGRLTLAADVINPDPVENRYTVTATVTDATGAEVRRAVAAGVVAAGAADRIAIEAAVPGAEPWSAEVPRLHTLDVVVDAGDGSAPQAYRRRIGFRRVEVRGRQLLVNGAPIRVRGMNRHDSRILKGRALSADDIRGDVLNLRHLNINVIRTSHYPPSPHLLDACDELGMFVLEQPPICFSGGFDDHHWTRTNEAAEQIPILLEVTAETIERDAGRASVIVWDLGNESRWGAGFDAQLALVRQIDPTRPTIFSFDLNELGPENELVRKDPADRPELRSYHYPGWDRTWREDLWWLNSYDQPVILDEYAPVLAPCLRGPGEGYGMAIDPGIRDFWGAGYQPFMEAALQDRGVLGGLIWGGFGEVFAIPLDLTIGEGPWAHLPVTDYVRTHDHYPPEPGVFRRGDGDWGVFDAWNRPRPEAWHVHQFYAPIRVGTESFAAGGSRLEIELRNTFAHRSLDGITARVTGGTLGAGALAAAPNESAWLSIERAAGAADGRLELLHEEGWLVADHRWTWPGAAPTPGDAALAAAVPPRIRIGDGGSLVVEGGGRSWLVDWPELHLLDVDQPHIAVPGATVDRGRVGVVGPDEIRAALDGTDWSGSLSVRVDGRTVVFEYEATCRGSRRYAAKEIGLTLRPVPDLRELRWRRVAEWTAYPETHIGRPAGRAGGRPGVSRVLHPTPTWEEETTAAGSNDFRSVKRRILVAGLADRVSSLAVVSDGSQHVRAELVDGAPVLHVLDWYGGVRTVEGNHPIWSAYLGFGRPIGEGTVVRGSVVVAVGDLPLP